MRFRGALAQRKIFYLADIPSDLKVYRREPRLDIPRKRKGVKGRPYKRAKIRNRVKPLEVRALAKLPQVVFQNVELRACERGRLSCECAALPVWTLTKAQEVRREWLFIRREHDGQLSYSLSNALEDTPVQVLAQWRAERYFIERTFQDAKSEGGWDELVAQKYRAWMHHTALDALTLWFMAQTKLDWTQAHPRDPKLREELQLERLPALSTANVRELLREVMPLKEFTVTQAIAVVVRHLVDRSASTRSRLKTQREILKEQKHRTST
jgi:SRSO17 transposase